MYKVILIPSSLFNESIDYAEVWDFKSGEFVRGEECTDESGFWIECTLPVIPEKGSLIDISGIEMDDMLRQLTEVYKKSRGFREIIRKYCCDNKISLSGDISIEESLRCFCGLEYRYRSESLYSGCWYAQRCSYRANDEYIYINIGHDF